MAIKVSFMKLEDIHPIMDLERDLYPVEGIMDEEEIINRFNKNIYQSLVAKDESGQILGAINVMPITQETFDKILDKTFNEENDLGYDNLLPLENGMSANFYCSSFVTNYDAEVAARIMYSLVTYARMLRKKNIMMNKLACIAATKDGERLCEKLGFDKIYELDTYICGFVPKMFILDLHKESKSFLINKVKKILLK